MGALVAMLLWGATAGCMGRHRGLGTCRPMHATGEQYRAFGVIGALVGFLAAYVSNAPVRHRPPIEDDL